MPLDHRPFDLWLYHGDNAVSTAIALASCWPSQWIRGVTPTHVSVMGDHAGPMIFESTTLCDQPCAIQGKHVKGIQAHRPDDKLRTYRGRIWRIRLADWPASQWKIGALNQFCLGALGDQYDTAGLLESGSILRYARFWRPPAKSFICSRFTMLALRAGYVVDRMVVPCEWTPARIERDLTHDELYLPVERLK